MTEEQIQKAIRAMSHAAVELFTRMAESTIDDGRTQAQLMKGAIFATAASSVQSKEDVEILMKMAKQGLLIQHEGCDCKGCDNRRSEEAQHTGGVH